MVASCGATGALAWISPAKAERSIGALPASIQLRLPLLTLSVGRTQPSAIHCLSVSKSVSKTPSGVLTRHVSAWVLIALSSVICRFLVRRKKSESRFEIFAVFSRGQKGENSNDRIAEGAPEASSILICRDKRSQYLGLRATKSRV